MTINGRMDKIEKLMKTEDVINMTPAEIEKLRAKIAARVDAILANPEENKQALDRLVEVLNDSRNTN